MYKITALLAGLAATSSASTFYLTDFTAEDFRLEPQSHTVHFNISPVDTSKHHGPAPASCEISWTDAPPQCLTQCGSSDYYAQIVPGTYEGAYDFDLKISTGAAGGRAKKTATLNVQEGEDDYFCSRGGQSTICSYGTEESSVDVKAGRAHRGPGGATGVCNQRPWLKRGSWTVI